MWAPGTYRGSYTYKYGSGQDIYFGKNFTGNPDDVTINFVLTVQPDMYIHFPGASGGVVSTNLVPPGGGWPSWQDRTPPILSADVPFDFGTLGPVKLSLRCQYPAGDTCGIVDLSQPSGAPLAVDTLLTDMGLNDDSGKSAINSRLTTAARVFTPNMKGRLAIQSAHLSFNTQQGVTSQMQAGHEYGGRTTIVFDSSVN